MTFSYLLDDTDCLDGLVRYELSSSLSVRGEVRGVLGVEVRGACHQQCVRATPEVVVCLRLEGEEGGREGGREKGWGVRGEGGREGEGRNKSQSYRKTCTRQKALLTKLNFYSLKL